MKKVVDCGALRWEGLTSFLSASTSNIAVLTDYAFRESFKGTGDTNIRRSFVILSQYTGQVLVLKGTKEISKLTPREKGLRSRLIDESATASFSKYCKAVYSNSPGIDADIQRKQVKANLFFDSSTESTETLRQGMGMIVKGFPPEDLKRLRKKQPLSEALCSKIADYSMVTTRARWKEVNPENSSPTDSEISFSFPFRYVVSAFALTLDWVSEGGLESVQTENLKNDFTDMTYAAYATFFDGLISKDQKMQRVHRQTCWLLKNLFRLETHSPSNYW